MGTSATNKYIKDPIPSRPHAVSANGTGTQAAAATSFNPNVSTPNSGNLDGRIVAVQREISAIKSGILSAQKQALVKAGKISHEASSSHIVVMPSATPPPADSTITRHRPIVLGLLAEPQNKAQGADSSYVEAAENDESGAELKKRKRVKAVKDKQDDDSIGSGAEGIEIDVTRVGDGINDVMFIDNPMYEATNVTAGPDDQACREL
jgi:hypothetical protein